MFGNTLTLTINAVAIVMNKIREQDYSSEYLFRDGTHQVVAKIRHSRTKASAITPSYDRHNFEVVQTIFADGTDPQFQRKFYFVQEQLASDTDVEMANAVCDWAIASSNASLVSLLGWES